MRIVIDMQGAQSPGSSTRGIGRYTRALAKSIIAKKGDHEILLALNGSFEESVRHIKSEFGTLLPPNSIRVWHPIGPVSFHENANQQRRLVAEAHRELFLASLAPDAVLVSSLFEGFSDDAVGSIGWLPTNYATCAVLYDLIPLIRCDPYLADSSVERWYMNRLDHLQRADALFAISESSRQEALEYLNVPGNRAIYIGTDADAQFKSALVSKCQWSAIQSHYGLSKSFVMYTGGIDYRKNIDALIRAFARLPKKTLDQFQLAIVCSTSEREKARLRSLASEAGMPSDGLVLTGFVPEDDLIAFYSRCNLFVFPSLHEGFGLPALEAMRCGAPVIASDCSSLPEVVGSEFAMFDPTDMPSMTRAMARALQDPKHLKKLRENSALQSGKFSWDDIGVRAISGLEAAVVRSEFRPSSDRRRPTMAYISPLPPAKSGIADVSAEILPELSRYYNIDVVLKSGAEFPSDPYATGAFRCIDEAAFRRSWRSYDRILYQVGNSDHHSHMFDLLETTGGAVVLHDFFLSNVMEYCQATTPPHDALSRELYHSHGYPALVAAGNAGSLSEVVWRYPCSRRVFDNAYGVVLHSRYAERLAREWYGSSLSTPAETVPLARVFAKTVDRQVARRNLSISEDCFIVCSFGMVGPTKLTHKLIEAWHRTGFADDADCRLALVGENAEGEYGKSLLEQLDRLGLGNVEFTGWADSETFRTYLAASDVAVQLRTLSRGETSAAALDCLNFGVPLIVNANGSMAELPESATTILPDDFAIEDLASAIRELRDDTGKRRRMAKNGRNLVQQLHSPRVCAELYAGAIERFYVRREVGIEFERSLARLEVDPVTMVTVAERVVQDIASPQARLFVDVSLLARFDARTGIQRVVRSLVLEMTSHDQAFRVEPCYYCEKSGRFRYARNFMSQFLGVQLGALTDDVVDFSASDTLLCLDFNPVGIMPAAGYLNELRHSDVRVAFVVYDLLPVKHPEFFEAGMDEHHRRWLELVLSADQAVCISQAVATDLKEFSAKWTSSATAEISHFPLGADFVRYSDDWAAEKPDTAVAGFGQPTFLMVGTIEPRKGHELVLDAFERLWADGKDVQLCIVGKQGWLVEDLAKRLRTISAVESRLKWLESTDDEALSQLYRSATCLIAASRDEGYGLPIIEAANYDLPVLARNIPVFREVGGSWATYFPRDASAASLSKSITIWLDRWVAGECPTGAQPKLISWRESADALIECLSMETPDNVRAGRSEDDQPIARLSTISARRPLKAVPA